MNRSFPIGTHAVQITTEHAASRDGQPVVLVDGVLTTLSWHLVEVMLEHPDAAAAFERLLDTPAPYLVFPLDTSTDSILFAEHLRRLSQRAWRANDVQLAIELEAVAFRCCGVSFQAERQAHLDGIQQRRAKDRPT